MQLKRSMGSRPAGPLAVAALQLLGGSLIAGGAQARETGSWNLEQATLVYRETRQVQVVEPVVRLSRALKNGQEISFRFGYDSMSGASPNGSIPASTAQTFTSPSGNSYTAQAGELPRRSFRDTRYSGGIEWTRSLLEHLKGTLGSSLSNETDYLSVGASWSMTWEVNQRLSTFNLGLSYNHDTVSPKGGLPVGLERMEDRLENGDSDTKSISDVLVGVTQVMNERWLLQLNIGSGVDSGYLTEPYKGVSVLDSSGSPQVGGSINEARPESRARSTLMVRNMVHLGRDVLHFGYRFYRDDWGVRSHTLDVKYWWKPDQIFGHGGFKLRPHLRWSGQQAADFHRPWITAGQVSGVQPGSGAHVSADHRLGDMTSFTLGARMDLPPFAWGGMWIKPEFMRQSWTLDAPVPAGLSGHELVPDLDVLMVTLGLNTRF